MPPGLWGFASLKNRLIAQKLFQIITDPNKKAWFIQYYNNKNIEKYFVLKNIIKYVRNNSTSHDSFFCNKYGGKPFPSKRTSEYCHIGSYGCCLNSETNNYYSHSFKSIIYQCPLICRPRNHSEWIFC